MIEQSAAVNAASVAVNEVTKIFRSSLESMVCVRVKLDRRQQAIVERETGPYVRFLQENAVSNDHAVMYALREVVRTTYARNANPKHTKFKTLCVGVGWREVQDYWDNDNVYFYYDGSEAKDVSRFVLKALDKLLATKVKTFNKKKTETVRLKIDNVQSCINTLQSVGSLPTRFVDLKTFDAVANGAFHQVLLEDVGYNFSEKDWLDLFEKTGAMQAIGYMALPYELVFDNIMESDYYRYSETGEFANMTYEYATGYRHKKNSWRTLLHKPFIQGERFSLAVELISRCGAMTVFQILRVPNTVKEITVRTLALPDHLRTVGVLDLARVTNNGGAINVLPKDFHYIKMRKNELDDLINYIMSLDEKSHKLQNVVLYLRRRVSGVSLVTTELVSKWQVREKDIPTIALCALIYTQHQLVMFGRIQTSLGVDSWLSLLGSWIRGVTNTALKPLYTALSPLLESKLVNKLIVGAEDKIFQQANLESGNVALFDKTFVYNVDVDTFEDDVVEDVRPVCTFCDKVSGIIGDQEVVCKPGTKTHDFSLTDTEVKIFREALENTELDPIGIKEVKARALAHCPNSGFVVEGVRVHYIRGGPGTGKSRLIKALAGAEDLIVGPFSKLKADYSGESKKMFTQHIAMTKINHKRVFVDEFTALPYEFLACIVKNVNAEEVYLVGDMGQTGVLEGVEGMNTATKINFEELDTHTLTYDFRNPRDAVAALNEFYNYELKEKVNEFGFKFRHLNLWNAKAEEVPLCFTHASAVSLGLDAETANKVTVRANQGQTHDRTALFITAHDINLLKISCLSVVALSRHRKSCTIYHDNHPETRAYVANLKTFVYSQMTSAVPVPKSNTCLLEAFQKLISNVPSLSITLMDVWFSFVVTVGIDTARELSGAMLSSDHLKILCDDFGVSVQFRSNGTTRLIGNGPLIGEITWRNNHFKATALAEASLRPGHLKGFSVKDASTSSSTHRCTENHEIGVVSRVVSKNANFQTPYQLGKVRYGLFGTEVERNGFKSLNVPRALEQVLTKLSSKFSGFVEVFRSVHQHTLEVDVNVGKVYVATNVTTGFSVCGDYIMKTVPSDVYVVTGCRKIRVSLTSHDEYIVVAHCEDDLPVLGGHDPSEGFMQHVSVFDTPEDVSMITPQNNFCEPEVIVPLEQFGYDSYKHLADMFDIHHGALAQFSNEVASTTIGDKFRTGTISGNFIWRISRRGNPMQDNVKGYCLTQNAPGLYYFKKSAYQELQCLQSRYLGNKLAADFDIVGKGIADEIADMFVDEHMDTSIVIDMDAINSTLRDSYAAMFQKKYDKIVKPELMGIDSDVVNFHMKDIFKPYKTSVDLGKVGQGISAWSKDAQSLFQNGCRLVNLLFKKQLKAHCVYDNLESESDIFQKVNSLLSSLPKVCVNGVIDATACDSGQNEFTQAIERRILSRMGVSEVFLGWYYRYRREYRIQGSDVRAKITGIKTSGEPATLLCNTVLMMALMNALLRGEGPCVLLGKGDDGLKRQANLKFNQAIVSRFSKYTVLDFKVEIDKPVNFCGNALVGGSLYPCIVRKAFKVLGHTFRDYPHFCEYQQSLRDWILQVNKLGVMETVTCTAMFSGFSTNEVYLIFGMLVSMSHINAAQFLNSFKFVTREFSSGVPLQDCPSKSPLNFSAYGGVSSG